MGKNLILVLTGLIVILIATVVYFALQNQELLKRLPSASPSPLATQLTTPTSSPPTASPIPTTTLTLGELQENITDAINSQNTAALATYMTNPIQVILQATECCGPQTPTEAASQLAYIKEGLPFDFNQDSEIIKNLKTKNPELAGQFIGLSKSKEHLIAFSINAQTKIDSIRMSVSWKLFNY